MLKKTGFTLAEVLITLGIIGVVAAMTIPTLINQTKDSDMKAGFKKAVSALNQAITLNFALDGNDFADLRGTASTISSLSPYYMFVTRMNVVSVSSAANATLGGPFGTTNNYTMFLNDGMAITFATNVPAADPGCSAPNIAACKMVVDVNGAKGPNALSTAVTSGKIKDQFVLNFYNGQVVPNDNKAKYVLTGN